MDTTPTFVALMVTQTSRFLFAFNAIHDLAIQTREELSSGNKKLFHTVLLIVSKDLSESEVKTLQEYAIGVGISQTYFIRAKETESIGIQRNHIFDLLNVESFVSENVIPTTYGFFWDDDEFRAKEYLLNFYRTIKGGHFKVACLLSRCTVYAYGFYLGCRVTGVEPTIAFPISCKARFPDRDKTEDANFVQQLRDEMTTIYVRQDTPAIFSRVFHGKNIWDASHFLATVTHKYELGFTKLKEYRSRYEAWHNGQAGKVKPIVYLSAFEKDSASILSITNWCLKNGFELKLSSEQRSPELPETHFIYLPKGTIITNPTYNQYDFDNGLAAFPELIRTGKTWRIGDFAALAITEDDKEDFHAKLNKEPTGAFHHKLF